MNSHFFILFIKLFHIHTLCTEDLCLDLLFVLIKNLDLYRLSCNSPASDPQESLLYLFFFYKELWSAFSFFQFFYRYRKPWNGFVRHICINSQFVVSFQRFRKLYGCCDTLSTHQIRVLETLQCAYHFQTFDLSFYF